MRRVSALMVALVLALGPEYCLLGIVRSGASAAVASPSIAGPAGSPSVEVVYPDSAPNDLDTPVVITGTGFAAVISDTLVMASP